MNIKLNSKLAGILFAAIVISHLTIVSGLIFFPYPELFIYPYLTNNGLVPYKDILDQHFPGLMFLPVNLDNLGMTDAAAARYWQLSLIGLSQLALFWVVYKITRSWIKSLAASAGYLIWQPFLEGWVLWINNFLPVLYLPAFYLTYSFLQNKQKNYRNLLLVGLLLGLATVFKQVAIPLAGMVFLLLFFYHRNLKTFIYFSAGYLPPVIMMLFYILNLGAFPGFWYWTVQFNLTSYAAEGGKSPTFTQLIRVLGIYFPVALLPFTAGKNRLLGVCISVFLIGSLSGAWHRFDFVHFQPSLPFVIIAAVLSMDKIFRQKWLQVAGIGYLIMASVWLTHFYRGHTGEYIYYFDDDTIKTAETVRTLAGPGEEIFVFGTSPIIYQMSGTIPAGKVFVFQFPWFMKVAGERVLEGIKSSRPNIIVADFSTQTQTYKITEFAPEIYKYILENYHEEYQIGSNKILVRKANYAFKN